MTDAKPPRHVWVCVDARGKPTGVLPSPKLSLPSHRYRLDDEPAQGTRWVVRDDAGFYCRVPGPPSRGSDCEKQRDAFRFTSLAEAVAETHHWFSKAKAYRLTPKPKAKS